MTTPSQVVEDLRWLSGSHSPSPGPYRFDKTPYLREIVDCFDVDSPVKDVAVMHGGRLGIGASIENVILYFLAHVKTASVMLVSVDRELAKLRRSCFIDPMIVDSGLGLHITDRTETKLSWKGGFLMSAGADLLTHLRTVPIRVLLREFIDAYPEHSTYDPLAVTAKRTRCYSATYKLLDASIPTFAKISRIEDRFKIGDQRQYLVCCFGCGYSQPLCGYSQPSHWLKGMSSMSWETEGGALVRGSAQWSCVQCSRSHSDADKEKLLSPSQGAKWVPSFPTTYPDFRSYHLPALYSPFVSFDDVVTEWLECWDPEKDRPKDELKARAFFNTVLAVPWESV